MLSILPGMKRWKRLLASGTILILLLTLLSPLCLSPAMAGGSVTVSIDVPGKVAKGAEFVARVDVSQVDNFDAGNYDVSFNPTILKVTDVTSGRIGDTIIPVDIWNESSSGLVTIVQNVPGILGVTGSGYLARIHFRALSQGISNITPSNGVLGDKQAQKLPADWLGTSIEVEEVRLEASAPPVVVLPDVTLAASYVTEEGVFTRDVTAQSEDNKVVLTINKGTVAKAKVGAPISQLSATGMAEPPLAPVDSSIVGLAYDLGPDGTTFTPPITLTFTYDPVDIPEGVSEGDLVIAMWDEAAAERLVLDGFTVDPVTHTITALVSHFTPFAVIAPAPEEEEVVPSEEEVVPPEEKVVPAEEEVIPPAEEEAPAKPINWGLIGGIIAGVVAVGLPIIFLLIRRRQEL